MSLLSPQLIAFMAVAQCKTVHGAAETIHITQTAVTQRIRTLENRLATSLFTRTRRGMMLTAEGETLLRYCHATLELEGEALGKLKGAGIQSEIQIGITGPSSIMRSRIIPQCGSVLKLFPKLLLHFDINDRETRVKSLRAGETQLAVIRQEDVIPEMDSKLLAAERYVLVCTRRWQHRSLEDIIQTERIIDYDPLDHMTFNYLKQCGLLELARHDRHFVNRTDSLAMMLVAGHGYGLLTTEFSEHYLQQEQLMVLNPGTIYENVLALAWYARHEPPSYFSALINTIN